MADNVSVADAVMKFINARVRKDNLTVGDLIEVVGRVNCALALWLSEPLKDTPPQAVLDVISATASECLRISTGTETTTETEVGEHERNC